MSSGSNHAARLRPVDSLDILVIVDNVTDALSTVPQGVANETAALIKAGMKRMSGTAKCCAHHGLSLLLTARAGEETHTLLFDAGPEGYVFHRNSDLLGVPYADIEAIALSHGHWDHTGGLIEALSQISKARAGQRVPVHLNEGMLVARANTLPDGSYLPYEEVPSPKEIESAGGDPVVSSDPRLIGEGFFYLSGEIPRVTPYEIGYPGHMKRSADGGSWEPDPWIRDERFLAVHVAGKGIIVLSMCSHAGVVNVLRNARDVFDGTALHAVVGGFHLSGPTVEKAIPETIRDLMSFGLARIVPAHCTGWRAFTALSRACEPDRLTPSAVGRRFTF